MKAVPTRQLLEEELWDYVQRLFEGREILSLYITKTNKGKTPSAYVCCWDERREFVRNVRVSFHKIGRKTKNVDLGLLIDRSIGKNKKCLKSFLKEFGQPKFLYMQHEGVFTIFYHTTGLRVKVHRTEAKAVVQTYLSEKDQWKSLQHFEGNEYRKIVSAKYAAQKS